jgi:hypothetical protein
MNRIHMAIGAAIGVLVGVVVAMGIAALIPGGEKWRPSIRAFCVGGGAALGAMISRDFF